MYEQFAAERTSKLAAFDDELLPVVRAALKDFDPKKAWYAPIVDKAEALFYDAGGSGSTAAFLKDLRETLAKTKDPENTSGQTDERTAKWVATYIVNGAEHSSGGDDTTKTWVSMHDDKVRHVHQLLDGKTIPTADKFDVDGARLSFPGQPVGDPAGWINCRCILKTEKGADMALTADVGPNKDPENEPPVADPADLPAEKPDEPKVDDTAEVPFHGVATVTDTPTGDNRQLAGAGFTTRPLPLPLFYQRATSEGHDGGTIVGQFTKMELVGNEVQYEGKFNFTPEASEAIQGVAEGWLKGVSVDLDDVIVDYSAEPTFDENADPAEIMDAMQRQVTVMKEWRVAGLTMVGIPAFYQAYIALGTRVEADASKEHTEPAPSKEDQALVAAAFSTERFAPGTHDGPGWITAPVPTGRIRRYWTHGEGAAKIAWGVPGDFNRCRGQLAKYIENQDWLAGACANMHKEATGAWPGHAATEAGEHSLLAKASMVASAFNLVASAAVTERPPIAWFQDPGLTRATPITIDGDHIYGHIATWGTCHIGLPGQCTTAPNSMTNYAWFRLGAIETDAGLVPVGPITMNTGHAGLRADVANAAAHYDNTGTVVADVATGEDAYGIWFSGRVRKSVDEDQRAALLAAKLSGDWREVQGNLELVAALAVNTPGFGIPRVGLAASGQVQTALVAAGMVDPVPQGDSLGINEQMLQRLARLEAAERGRRFSAIDTARLRVLAEQRKHDRLEAVRSRLGR